MTPTRQHRITAYRIVCGEDPPDEPITKAWIDDFIDGGPPVFVGETRVAWLVAEAEDEAIAAAAAPLIREVARLNFELGKAEGELNGLRLMVTPYEAWEQGYDAHKGQKNPYPAPTS